MRRNLLLLFVTLLPLVASAYDAEINGIYYYLNPENSRASVTGVPDNYIGAVNIPKTITYNGTTYSVVYIQEEAFSGCTGITSVTIPNSILSIGGCAFSGCTGLTSITIPSSVVQIGYGGNPFDGCANLSSIIVETGNTTYDSRNDCNAIIKTATNTLMIGCQNTIIPNSVTSIGNNAFEGCNGLTCISIASSVTSIGHGAFRDCTGLASVTIPDGVTKIGSDAFDGCVSLMSVFIPNSVQEIDCNVFYGCNSLTSIKVDPENEHYDSRGNCNAIIEKETNTLITGCMNTVIPTSVKIIGSSAFADCTSLVSITIPNSVTTIEEEAFAGCSGLTSVLIPNSVIFIDEGAFAESGLTSIIIPKSVTFVDAYAFAGCNSLTSIVVESGNNVYDSRDNCNAIIETAADSLIAGCINTIIPTTVKTIGCAAFAGYTSLTSISIPNSVTAIDEEAFCFSGLTCMILPNNVTSVGHEAFSMCENLTDVVIGSDMTSIASDAFEDCSSLNNVYCYATEPPVAAYNYWSDYFSYAFDLSHIEEHTTLHVPEGSLDTYRATAPWSNFKNIVPLTENDPTPEDDPDGIREIKNESLTPALSNGEGVWYSLDGKKHGKPQNGINIIHYSDGTTRKVLIK